MDKGLKPFKIRLRREVTLEEACLELKFIRISASYDSEKADNEIRQIEEEFLRSQHDLDHLTESRRGLLRYASKAASRRAAGSVAPSCANSTPIPARGGRHERQGVWTGTSEGFLQVPANLSDAESSATARDMTTDVVHGRKTGTLRDHLSVSTRPSSIKTSSLYWGPFKRNDDRK